MRRWPLIGVVWLLAQLAAGGAHADGGHHSVWSVKGRSNTVFLFGSVHMLPRDASSLPPDSLRAYDQAEALVMEVDLNLLPAVGASSAARLQTHLPAGQTLQQVLGRRATARLAVHARRLGLDMRALAPLQPWYVAVMVEQQELARLGFDGEFGVDMQFAQHAQVDGKPIIALETAEQQLALFATLSPKQQRQYLLYTLKDLEHSATDADELVTAWRNGDWSTMVRRLNESAADFPALHRRLMIDRNLRWLPAISRLTSDNRDYLVVVGALHLVGHDGLVQLLQRAGFEVRQL